MSFTQDALCKALQQRRLLCEDVAQSHKKALLAINKLSLTDWNISLGNNLLFDLAGLKILHYAIQSYKGKANQLSFKLKLSAEAIRDYYSHNSYLNGDYIDLSIKAVKLSRNNSHKQQEVIFLSIDELNTPVNYPLSLTSVDINSTPLALLMPYSCDHDCLFANQIAIFSNLNQNIRNSPFSWVKALFNHRKISLHRRISLAWKKVHPTADIHPSAIIEGSVIGKNCRIGAHCVVRYSILGEDIVLHDGAKAEYSVIDNKTWLMHDLVLYRCLVETNVFLIHGPYQFSYFQNQSAAFASIMMDYRPDNKPIRINTPNGVQDYQGRFLGALLEEKAKVLGGTLTAPGITIPFKREITCDINAITTAKSLELKTEL